MDEEDIADQKLAQKYCSYMKSPSQTQSKAMLLSLRQLMTYPLKEIDSMKMNPTKRNLAHLKQRFWVIKKNRELNAPIMRWMLKNHLIKIELPIGKSNPKFLIPTEKGTRVHKLAEIMIMLGK